MLDNAPSSDWVTLLAPAVAGLVLAAGVVLGALFTGVVARLKVWLEAHGQAATAQAVASAGAVIQPALQTGASVIAGKIASGTLDYTNRQQILAEATLEVEFVKQRVPSMLAIAAPLEGALVASMMGKVDALMVAATSPAPVTPQTIAVAVPPTDQAATARLDVVPTVTPPAIAPLTLSAGTTPNAVPSVAKTS